MSILLLPETYSEPIYNLWDSTSKEIKEEGIGWYLDAHLKLFNLSRKYDVPLPIVAGVTARLSPAVRWSQNIKATEKLLIDRTAKVDGYLTNRKIALRILAQEFGSTSCSVSFSFPKRAQKIFSFYHNLLHPLESTHITLDRWMMRIVPDSPYADKRIPTSIYQVYSQAIRDCAEKLDLKGLELQAVLWLQIRSM